VNLLIFADSNRLDTNQIRVEGRQLEHLRQVLKVQVGESLRVGELNGHCGVGTVLELGPYEAILALELTEPPPPKLPLTLILALPRPKMLRRILRTVAELGVANLHLLNSYRVEKSYWSTPALGAEKVQEYFIQGLEQARDTVLPELHLHRRFKPFVEDQLPALLANKRGLAAHPGDYPPCPRGTQEAVVLVIGPEGGFIPYEAEKLQRAGCEIVSLGKRILRVETAVSSIIGRLF
jgi:RsmE family RNA methyltransferase